MSSRRATEHGEVVHHVAQGGQGPMASKKYGVVNTAVLRPPLEILNFLSWLTTNFYFQGSIHKSELDCKSLTVWTPLNFKIFHIIPKGNISTINKNKGLGLVESSGFSILFLAQLKKKF